MDLLGNKLMYWERANIDIEDEDSKDKSILKKIPFTLE